MPSDQLLGRYKCPISQRSAFPPDCFLTRLELCATSISEPPAPAREKVPASRKLPNVPNLVIINPSGAYDAVADLEYQHYIAL